MMNSRPKVSIGLPVFNGEKYIREAIDSMLAQTFTDFELIISDNASTDETQAICQDYAARDPRIRYYRNESNIGAAKNENRTFELSSGHYFRLAAHDDVLAPPLLEKCVEVLDRDELIVLCYTETAVINEFGEQLKVLSHEYAASDSPQQRFFDLARQHDCEPSYGLVRADAMRISHLQPDYPESDFGFLCELSLQGKFYLIREPLFYQRIHVSRISASSNLYQKMVSYRVDSRGCIKAEPSALELVAFHLHYFYLQLSHYFQIIQRAPVSFRDKLYCCFYALRWICYRLFLNATREFRHRFLLTREGLSNLRNK